MAGKSNYFSAGKKEEVARLELQAEYLSDVLLAAFDLIQLRPGLKVLEVGCGTGAVARKIALAVRPARLVAVDIDEVFLEHARTLAKSEIANIDFELGDVNGLRYPDNSFDLTFCRLLLRHQDDPVRSLKEMKRVTKKGGCVAVMEADEATMTTYPPDRSDEIVGKAFQWLYSRSRQDTQIGRKLGALFVDTRFSEVEIHPLTLCFTHSNAAQLRPVIESVLSLLRMIREMPGGASVLSDEEMAVAIDELQRFPSNPRAFFSETYFLAIARV